MEQLDERPALAEVQIADFSYVTHRRSLLSISFLVAFRCPARPSVNFCLAVYMSELDIEHAITKQTATLGLTIEDKPTSARCTV